MEEKNKKDSEIIDFGEVGNSEKKATSKKKINIFDEFNTDKSLEEEIKGVKKKQDKDLFFYMSIFSKTFQIGFFVLFFIVLLGWIYIFVQKNESINSQSFLDPVCNFLIGDLPFPETNCSSISYANNYYNNKVEEVKTSQVKSILEILPKVYQKNNFENTKEVSFLIDKSEDRLKVLEVLSKFDKMKNNFTGLEKNRIICKNFSISSQDMTLSCNCEAYSKGFESSIRGFSGDDKNVRGTSISVANSFLNYIEKKSEYFTLLDRQKVFDTEAVIDGDSGYRKQTNFSLKLKINN